MIIINADDFGKDKNTSEAIVKCFENKLINSTSLMVNMEYTDAAVDLSKKNGLDNYVGLHLNLTEGFPLTNKIKKCKAFCNINGEFTGKIHLLKKFFLSKSEREAVYEEIDSQCKKFISYGYNFNRLDSHHHIHTNISILNIICLVLNNNNFKSIYIRKSRNLIIVNIFKRIYKKMINRKIEKSFRTTKYFCSIDEYYDFECIEKDNIEIMIHPYLVRQTLFLKEKTSINSLSKLNLL